MELQVRTDKCRLPLREHAIFLLEALIEAIDINDCEKLSLSLQANLELLPSNIRRVVAVMHGWA